MTDRTPSTAAGRAMYAKWGHHNFVDEWNATILAIEDEARAPLEAEIERLRRVLEAAAEWEAYYGDIDTDGKESWMTQLDHDHEEYEVRIELMAALRAALREDQAEARAPLDEHRGLTVDEWAVHLRSCSGCAARWAALEEPTP